MGKDVIIACDFDSKEKLIGFLDKFGDIKPFLKIGMELFYAEGPEIVREVKKRGYKVFLDLKLHDIPNTVKKSMAVLQNLNVDMTNVHAAGTSQMMKAAREGFGDGLLIGVTQLTSTDEQTMNDEILIPGKIEDVVVRYAQTVKASGLSGVVCSPLEVKRIKEACGEDFITVTPGIRFSGGEKGDQKRVTTPEDAKLIGSDYIVVGRPITQSDDPVAAYKRCVKEFIG